LLLMHSGQSPMWRAPMRHWNEECGVFFLPGVEKTGGQLVFLCVEGQSLRDCVAVALCKRRAPRAASLSQLVARASEPVDSTSTPATGCARPCSRVDIPRLTRLRPQPILPAGGNWTQSPFSRARRSRTCKISAISAPSNTLPSCHHVL
jgi:hypothetical protein